VIANVSIVSFFIFIIVLFCVVVTERLKGGRKDGTFLSYIVDYTPFVMIFFLVVGIIASIFKF
jgi:hypothetical protein